MTLADHIEFGLPSNYAAAHTPMPKFRNHKEDLAYACHVTDYVETKLRKGALLGPFDVPPFTPLSPVQPHNDEAQTRAREVPNHRRSLISPGHECERRYSQEGIPQRTPLLLAPQCH